MSFNDAKSKLLGFLVALQAGHASFPPMDKATKCHVVPSAFKLYISLEDIGIKAQMMLMKRKLIPAPMPTQVLRPLTANLILIWLTG
jgi:hypothetical protein